MLSHDMESFETQLEQMPLEMERKEGRLKYIFFL